MLHTELHALSEDLSRLSSASGLNSKRELASEWTTTAHSLFLDLVGNTNRQWFVTWESVKTADPIDDGIEWEDLWMEAETRIAKPTTTAGRIAHILSQAECENVLKAIVDKNLNAGITVPQVKKCLGQTVRFSPSLAADWCKMPMAKREKLIATGHYFSTPKMDGLRCLFFLNMPDKQGAYSRALKPLKNLEAHYKALLTVFKDPCVIDGEILSATNDWADSVTAVKKSGSKVASVFHAFDYVPGDEFSSGKYEVSAYDRWIVLAEGLSELDPSMFRCVPKSPVKTLAAVDLHLRAALREGWEGTVLHDCTAPYACKRNNAWVKVKTWLSSEFTVVGFVVGSGKHLGRLGALEVSGDYTDDSGNTVTVKSEVGTGFSDAEREEIWASRDSWDGATVEIKFFEVTPPNKSGVCSLRFPSYLRRRTDLEE